MYRKNMRPVMSGMIAASLALGLVAMLPNSSIAVAQGEDHSAELTERASHAATVLDEIMAASDDDIPEWLLERAHCIAVIPGVVKAAFIAGGRHGKGLASCRVGNDWSQPSFVQISGASFGLQIGAESTDFVLVFTNRGASDDLASDQLTLGGDASVAAGPIGRTAEAGTNVELEAEIYAYSRSRGAFAGLSIEGAELSDDDDANRVAYGETVNTSSLLTSSASAPGLFAPFLNALRTHVPPLTDAEARGGVSIR